MESLIKKRKLEESELISSGDTGGVEQQPDQLGLDRADLTKLLEPLDRDAMHSILQQACLLHPDVLHEVRRYVDRDPAHRKLFVRGLGWDTKSDTLKSVFSAYGDLDEGIVIEDKVTRKSRGFGFVTFKHMDGALRALKEPSKRIDGRMTVCQFAAMSWASTAAAANPPEDISARKIYVGNVPVGVSAEKVLCLFSQFGEIAEGPLGFDKATGASKGFALIIYKTSEGARSALVEPYKSIEGHQVHCKLAVEGQKSKPPGEAAQAEVANRVANPGLIPGAPYGQPGQAGVYPFGLLPQGPRFNYGCQPQVAPYPQFYGNPPAPGQAPAAAAPAPGVPLHAVAQAGHHHYAYANAQQQHQQHQHQQHQQLAAAAAAAAAAAPPIGAPAARVQAAGVQSAYKG